ncbi:MAG: hypothetical protein ABMB14_19065 [Myxococcota bacterium]
MWFAVWNIAAFAQDWVPAGLYATPWDPPAVGSVEVYRMSGEGAEWLVVRAGGRALEGRAAYAVIAAAGAPAPVLARVGCGLVAPADAAAAPWTSAVAAIPDELEQHAHPPRLSGRDLTYWYRVDDGPVDLVGVTLHPDGTEVRRSSARAIVDQQRAAAAAFDQAVTQAEAASADRAAAAIRSLAQRDDPRLDRTLAALVRTHPLPIGRATALEQLVGRRRTAAVADAAAATRDPDPTVRRAAVQLLAGLGAPGRAAIEAATRDPDPTVAALARTLSAP